MMNEHGKSDNPIVPEKMSNKADMAAETMEGRGLAKGNRSEQNRLRTQGRAGVQSALGRIRQATQMEGRQQFTALCHHVYNVDMLRESYI
jgi:RNA-directed DNA polymerase